MLLLLFLLLWLLILQMADAMEMMILSILGPALHCDWLLPAWQQALMTSVWFNQSVQPICPTILSNQAIQPII